MLLATLGFAAWLGCATDNGDPPADDGSSGSPTSTATTKPTSTRPEFEASFPGDDAGTNPDPDSGSNPNPDGGGQTCNDPNDVGSSEPTAKDLGSLDDKDPTTLPSISGVVKGSADVDYYKFVGNDTIYGSVDPTLTSSSSGVEFCMFVSCLAGKGITFNGCTGGAQATSGIGNPGCCFTAPGSTTLDFNCDSTTDESATVFMRAKQTGNLCLNYSATYHY